MKITVFCTLLLASLVVVAVVSLGSVLSAFGCQGGPTFDDWEEYDG